MQMTPSGETTGVQLRPPTISDSMTWRGSQMRGLDPDFAVCKPLEPFDFLEGVVGSAVLDTKVGSKRPSATDFS
jgi:hypothetical protein